MFSRSSVPPGIAGSSALALLTCTFCMLQAALDAGDAAAVTARQLPAHDARLHCVDLADQFAAAGARSGAVQTFNFSGAQAAEERSQVGVATL